MKIIITIEPIAIPNIIIIFVVFVVIAVCYSYGVITYG
jgi:hypothetical protein